MGSDFAGSMISIHAAREGGDWATFTTTPKRMISIHAAREGGDSKTAVATYIGRIFQSTPPVKAATSTWAATLRGR